MTDDEATDSLATVFSGGVLVSSSKFVALGFGFLTQVAMARLLTESAYGDVVLALTVVNVATLAAKFGMDDGVMREFPHHEENPSKARGVVRASLGVAAVSGSLAGVAVFAFAPIIASRAFHDPSLTWLIRIAAVSVPFSVVGSIAVSLARGARDARTHAYVNQLFRPAVRFVLVGSLVVAGLNSAGAVAGQTAAIVLAGIASLVLARRVLPSFEVPATRMYRSVLAFSIPLALFQSMVFLVSNVDIYMLGYFASSAAVGVYNIAFQLGNLFTAVLTTIGFLLPPVLTRLYDEGKHVEMRRTYQVMTKWMVVVAVPLFVVLFGFPELVITLAFGDSYRDGAVVLRILAVGNFLAILLGLNARSLIGLGANKVVNYVLIAQTVVNIALNYVLIPIYGIAGAAVASMVAVLVSDILGSAVLYTRFGVHPFTRATFRPAVWTLGVGAAVSAALGFSIRAGAVAAVVVFPVAVLAAVEHQDAFLVEELESRSGIDLGPLLRLVRAAGDDPATVIQSLK